MADIDTPSAKESRTGERNVRNSNFITMELCWSHEFPSLKHHLESQATELAPFKLLKLSSLLIFSFENRSDKTGYGPLNHRLNHRTGAVPEDPQD